MGITRLPVLQKNNLKALWIVASLCLLQINSFLSGVVFIFIFTIFLRIPLDLLLPFYTILLPWERILGIPGIGSLTLLIQIQIIVRLVIIRKEKIQKGIRFVIIFYFCLYAIISFSANLNLSGFGLVFELVLMEILFKQKSTEKKGEIWNSIGRFYTFSAIVSCFFGVFHGLFAERWIDGLGRVKAFLGIQGANQTGFCLNIAILFLLTTSIPFKKKVFGLFICGAFIALTISFTSIVCLLLIFLSCILTDSLDGIKPQRSTKVFFVFVIVISIVIFISSPAGISIRYRITDILSNAEAGNYARATSGRTDLGELYLDSFNQLPVVNRMIGTFEFSRSFMMQSGNQYAYSHNTYIDILFYSGIIGVFIQLFASLLSLSTIQKGDILRKKLFILKILVIIEGFSLSIYSESFWFMWFSL